MTRARELAELATSYDSGSSLGFRNRIINGDMRIDQRNAGASVTINTALPFIADRFNGYSDLANMTGQRTQATVPVGFTYALGITVGTGASPTAGQISRLEQRIEGFNFGDLYWGGANAQAVTLSFWVRSSVTGTHSGAVGNSAGNRSYPFTFTISAANTWEYKTVTIAGDTTGTWLTDNGTGCKVLFNLGTGSTFLGTAGSWAASNLFGATGSVQLSATTGATFYITGVQLEAGTVATPFERRDYGRELMMCQRYARVIGDGISGVAPNANAVYFNYTFDQPMRAAPTVTLTDTTVLISDQYFSDYTSTGSAIIGNNQSSIGGRTSINGFSGLTTGRFHAAYGNTNQSFLLLSAEL